MEKENKAQVAWLYLSPPKPMLKKEAKGEKGDISDSELDEFICLAGLSLFRASASAIYWAGRA